MKVDSYLIAKIAGVSQATVSRAFSNPDKVSAATRQKIMDVAESMGYKPDKNASALRRRGTNTILLLYVKRGEGDYWTNVKRNYWIFTEAILSLTSFFEDQPYIFEIKQVNSIFSLKESEIRDHCDGVLVFDFVSEEEAAYIAEWNIPYVLCHRSIHLENYNHSATDNLGGGSLQGRYLKNCSCSRPVYILDEEDPFSHSLRKKGFIKIFPHARIINSSDIGEIKRALLDLMKKDIVDGIAFVNDMTLVKTVTRMFRKNYDIQKLFPIIGYDNSTELLVLDRKPASIEIGIRTIYRDAAEALLQLIRGERESIDLVHEPELILNEG